MGSPGHDSFRNGAPTPSPRRWRVLILTCRTPEIDFRLPLAEELQAAGHDVAYVFLRRRPILAEMSDPTVRRELSMPSFLRHAVAAFRPASPLLVFNTTNLVFPRLSRVLRLLIGGIWCFDMHDDLLYNREGARRAKLAAAERTLLAGSDLVVHAAPTLAELFPGSRHLGNASSIRPIERPQTDAGRVLVLASIDRRLDFAFLSRAAELNPQLGFDIFGQISEGDPEVSAKVEAMRASRPNVSYRGPYTNADLPGILGAYRATLAPYVAGSRLTHYLDPLRFYHCLNSGMEVVSTDIPGARHLEDRLHIVSSPDEVGPLVARLAAGGGLRNAGSLRPHITWQAKAEKLMTMVEAVAMRTDRQPRVKSRRPVGDEGRPS